MQTTNKYDVSLSDTAQAIVIEKRFNVSQIKRLKSDCKFVIDTKYFSRNSGIYVNILKLKMRHHPTGACIDSLTVKFNEKIKRQYCRPLEPGEIKSIEDASGKVKITVSIDRNTPFNDPEDYVEFQIVATAFKGKKNEEEEADGSHITSPISRLQRSYQRVQLQKECEEVVHQQQICERLNRELC